MDPLKEGMILKVGGSSLDMPMFHSLFDVMIILEKYTLLDLLKFGSLEAPTREMSA